jgi:hypothetical protein
MPSLNEDNIESNYTLSTLFGPASVTNSGEG